MRVKMRPWLIIETTVHRPEVLAMRLVLVNGPIPAELTAATCISYCVDGSNPVISASLCSPFNLACLYTKSISSSFFHPIKYPVIFPLRWMHGTVPHCIVMLDDVEAMKLRSTGAADGPGRDTLNKTASHNHIMVLPASLVTAIT